MKEIEAVVNKCNITIIENTEEKVITVDIIKFPGQKVWIGKKVGDYIIKASGKRCEIVKIESETLPLINVEYPKNPTKAPSPPLTYKEVEKRFGISISGFGRGINTNAKRDALVLISSFDKKNGNYGYHDCWIGKGIYSYSGEGDCGDQELTGRNKSIIEAGAEGKTIHLIVKFSSEEYYYKGEFGLIDCKLENERGKDGKMRKEYKFILATDNEDVVE